VRGLLRPAPQRGFSLAELLVASVLAGVVLASVGSALLAAQRFFRTQAQVLEVQQNVRVVAQVLAQELRGLDAPDGDLVVMSDTAVAFKAPRVFGVICGAPDIARSALVVRNSLTSGLRAVDPARDSVLVFRDGDPRVATDDRWLRASLAATGSAACADGAAGTRLTLGGAVGGLAQLDSVGPGSPVRAFEVVRYRLYDDGGGSWWLGTQSFTGGAWSVTSPIAGPLRPRDGVTFAFADAAGGVAASPAAVRLVRIVVRGRSPAPIRSPGRLATAYQDSAVLSVFLRNSAHAGP
jgi:prepilin-type N-terminal cleavage/methylation domain-containing protein